MAAAHLLNGLLTGQLCLAVDVERLGGVSLGVAGVLETVENVVGREMDQQGIEIEGSFGQHSGGDGVNSLRQARFALGAVDVGIGHGVVYNLRGDLFDHFGQRLRLSEINLRVVQADHLARAG